METYRPPVMCQSWRLWKEFQLQRLRVHKTGKNTMIYNKIETALSDRHVGSLNSGQIMSNYQCLQLHNSTLCLIFQIFPFAVSYKFMECQEQTAGLTPTHPRSLSVLLREHWKRRQTVSENDISFVLIPQHSTCLGVKSSDRLETGLLR